MKLLYKLIWVFPGKLRLLLKSVFIVSAVRLALWLIPFHVLMRLLRRRTRRTTKRQEVDHDAVNRVIWNVERASRLVPAATCLVQAIAAQILLSQIGEIADLRIGVARDETGGFQAHAWLEYQGEVVIGGSKSRSRFTTLPLFE